MTVIGGALLWWADRWRLPVNPSQKKTVVPRVAGPVALIFLLFRKRPVQWRIEAFRDAGMRMGVILLRKQNRFGCGMCGRGHE